MSLSCLSVVSPTALQRGATEWSASLYAFAKGDPDRCSRGLWRHRSKAAWCGHGFQPMHETGAPTLSDRFSEGARWTLVATAQIARRFVRPTGPPSTPVPQPGLSASLLFHPKV